MAKSKILLIVGLLTFLLSGCYDGEYFSKLEKVEHVKVVDVGTETIGKVSYTSITYISNETNKEVERQVEDTDYGFGDFYDSAKIFTDEIYVDLIIDDDGYIISIIPSEEVKFDGEES